MATNHTDFGKSFDRETCRPSDPFSNPFHASHAALAGEAREALPRPPRFVLPSTGQSPRERKKIRSTSRATSEITITRPLLHKTRPRPSLARFSNQRNSSCPPLPRSRKHSCAPPIVQSWHARGSSCNPFHRDFFLLSFFLFSFFRVFRGEA